MHQVIQNLRTGRLSVDCVPAPQVRPGHVLIANHFSAISAGTEKSLRTLAKKSLWGKAKERPDQVRRVLEKVRQEGFWPTVQQVFEKLDEPMAMGYCSAGVVLAAGAGVQEFQPGDRVASNGPHAERVCVPKHLCARAPDGVPLEQAAFAVLASIALQGVRLSRLVLGETAFVIGLGLVGQITVSLLKAAGVRAIATDLDAAKCELALRMGASHAAPRMTAEQVAALTGGLGADAVLIAASTPSDAPVSLAADAVRQKGRVVAIGAVGMNLPRRPFYFKEAEFVVSCSYGPGRYDPQYEEAGRDYPAAHVRWTEQRNLQAVLDLMQAGRLDVSPLISHRFAIDRAAEAYELIEQGREPALGVLLEYPAAEAVREESLSPAAPRPDIIDTHHETTATTSACAMAQRRRGGPTPINSHSLRDPAQLVALRPAAKPGEIGIGCLGAGNFARAVLLPKLCKVNGVRPEILCSAGGTSAAHTGRRLAFAAATTDEQAVFAHPGVTAVVIATRSNQHARQTIAALRAGKHVFVEKPLCLSFDELTEIEAELASSPSQSRLLTVGFNRRFSPAAVAVRNALAAISEPLTVSIRFNAGAIPADHWSQDDAVGGGRIIGEACHAIDLATFLCGSPVVRVFAESIGGRRAPAITDDQCFLTLRHSDGSVSNIAYLAGGDKAFPKERIEVFGGGQVAVIDDFRRAELWSRGRRRRLWRGVQDKGHAAELRAFIEAIRTGGPAPIAWSDIAKTTAASFLAVQSLRSGQACEVALPAAVRFAA